MDLIDFIKNITLRVEVNFPQIDTLLGRLEGRIDAAEGRLEGIMALTKEQLRAQIESGFSDLRALVSSETAEIAGMLITLRDTVGQLQAALDESNARQDLQDLGDLIQTQVGDVESRVSGMSDAMTPAPPPTPEPVPPSPPIEPVPVEGRR